MEEKINRLKAILKSYKSVIVGYSGGVDSTLLCYLANETLCEDFLAVTAVSELLSEKELSELTSIARKYNWKHITIKTNELKNELFTRNNTDRCKWCKDIRIKEMLNLANNKNFNTIATGDNIDDLSDYRPGLKHSLALGVKSPFIEAGLNKIEIRKLAHKLGLPNHSKPSNPCLASRFPYGTPITIKALKMVEKSEELLESLGYSHIRVRHHDKIARIEIDNSQIINLISFHSNLVTKKLKEIGYTYITLDLQGYRMGSLNEVKITEK